MVHDDAQWGVAQDELSQIQLNDNMGYDIPMHEHRLLGSPLAPTCTHDEPNLTQAGLSFVDHHKCTVVLNHFDCLPMFLPMVGDAPIEISENHLELSFTLELQTIVVSKDVVFPSCFVIRVIRNPPSRCNELGHSL